MISNAVHNEGCQSERYGERIYRYACAELRPEGSVYEEAQMEDEKKREMTKRERGRKRERDIQEDHAKGVVPLRETKVEEYGGRRGWRRRGRT